jgi:alpha-galactosidase
MKISITTSGALDIEGKDICLRGGYPVINSMALEDLQAEIVRDEAGLHLVQYVSPQLGSARLFLEISAGTQMERLWLRYWLEEYDFSTPLDSFGLHFNGIENLRAYLRSGYMSWDGSEYADVESLANLQPDQDRPETGYAMTQLLPRQGEHALVLGFDRHDRFQNSFQFNTRSCPPSLMIQTMWDQKDQAGLTSCASERMVILESEEVETELKEWACLLVEMSPLPPRHSAPITGWSSWYNLYTSISDEIILEHLHNTKSVMDREAIPMRVFQIDDGFTPEMGDWLEVKPQFPRGMKPVLDEIREAGFIPGLWIAPFMVGNRSHLFRDHPDWIVQERATRNPLVQWRHVGEYRWHKRSEEYYILDTTHPDAFDYLRQVFHIWRKEWGCEYFKTDFLHYASDHGPDRVLYHTPGLTRMEIWRKVAEMIREEIGDALWLGSGCPLWASIGLVDGVRIAKDIGVEWHGQLSAQSLLNDLSLRNFGNGILWQQDPDAILLRNNYHNLTDAELRSLAIYAGMSGGVCMTSDDLEELSDDRIRLWKFLLEMEPGCCSFPLLGNSPLLYDRKLAFDSNQPVARLADSVIVQVRSNIRTEPMESAVFIFNTGEHTVQRSYPLSALGLRAPLWIYDWIQAEAQSQPVDFISCTLDPHNGKLFLFSEAPYTERRMAQD